MIAGRAGPIERNEKRRGLTWLKAVVYVVRFVTRLLVNLLFSCTATVAIVEK